MSNLGARAGQDLEALTKEFWDRYHEWEAIVAEIKEIGLENFPYVNDVTRRTIRELMAQTSGAVQRTTEAAREVNKARIAAGLEPIKIDL
ncbi:unnamed protein product [Tilletia laevis]|nr:unnamed protein product [Tilletia caries]CAD6900582.1 unnamed protein product [Tilletia laevis]CAD6904663.1 unnamed protein product [Tilletia caries]CAD6914802.1 unnamed protein product [Tilletia caries]CAD6936882.1 unnamed protein product [Tilletia laevis]